MLIAKSAIDAFLNREFRDSSRAKMFSADAIDRKFATALANGELPLKSTLRTHQKVGFLLGIKYNRYILLYDMGLGKAIPDDEPVLTPSGYRKLKNLKIGSRVIGANGHPTRVVGIYLQGKKTVYRIGFSDGSHAYSTADHLWSVNSAARAWKGYPSKPQTLQYIMDTGLKMDCGVSRFYIPITQPVHFTSKGKLFLHPYVMGALLGDGHFSAGGASLSGSDEWKKEVVERVRTLLPESVEFRTTKIDHYIRKRWGPRKGGNCVVQELRRLGLDDKRSAEKFIPKIYLYTSIQDRLELLRGLLDTDAFVSKKGTVQYCSASKRLVQDLLFLVRSLGGLGRWTKTKIVKGRSYYQITINLPRWIEKPFHLPRKMNRYLKRRYKYPPSRAIVSVEELEEKQECRCIKVAAADGLFLTRNFVVTHNTLVASSLFLYQKLTNPNLRMLVLVPGTANVGQWADEIEKHTYLTCAALDVSGSENRMLLINGSADVVVTTYMGFLGLVCSGKPQIEASSGQLKKNAKTGEVLTKGWALDKRKLKIFQEHFAFVVADECTFLRNSQSLAHKAFKKLSWSAQWAYGLTGTPFGKKPEAVWGQFHAIDKGETFGPTLGLFRGALFIEKDDYWSFKKYVFDERKRRIFNRMLRHNSIRYKIEDCEDMPPQVKTVRPIIFSEEIWAYYDRLVAELGEARKGKAFDLMGNVFMRMRQLTSGYLVVKDPEKERVVIKFKQNPKLEALLEWIQEIPEDRKGIIFHEYKITGEIISERLKKDKIKHSRLFSGTPNKNAEVHKFLDNPHTRFMLSSSAGAYGGNWQTANYVTWFEEPVDPMIRKQEERRVYRIGQNLTTFYTYLLVKGSVDMRIHKALEKGDNLFTKLVEGKEDPSLFNRIS